jgi:hypothetical protein
MTIVAFDGRAQTLFRGEPTVSSEQQTIEAAYWEIVKEWLNAIDRVKPRDYVELGDVTVLPDRARVEQYSQEWADRFFTATANPWHADARRSVHRATPDTNDMLRHEYAVDGIPLEVIETVALTMVRLPAGPTPAPAAVRQIAAQLIRLAGTHVGQRLEPEPYTFVFALPDTLTEGVLFSTAATTNPVSMYSWAKRLDGGIRDRRLFFLGYKVRESTGGRRMALDGQHWFDGQAGN